MGLYDAICVVSITAATIARARWPPWVCTYSRVTTIGFDLLLVAGWINLLLHFYYYARS